MSDADAIKDARDVVDACLERESENRSEAVRDMEFAAGEQWDEEWMRGEERRRTQQARITINQLPQYLNQVRNDIRQNRPAIKARPVDDKADIELADIYEGILRHAQDQGKAEVARDTATDHAILHGLGWYRVTEDYTDAASFDREPIYLGIDEPHNVYHSDFHQVDGSDLTQVVLTSCVPTAQFKREHKGAEAASFNEAEQNQSDADQIVIAEHYRIKHRSDTLLMLEDGRTILESEAKRLITAGEHLPPPVRERKTSVPYVYWQQLSGAEELDSREIIGSIIPVFPVIGNHIRIQGRIIRFGLIRFARDPQRYYNWLKSAEIEYLENAPKAPWVGDARAFAPYQEYWQNANKVNYSYLPVAGATDSGETIQPPQRNQPAAIPSGITQAELTATDDIKKSLGMYSAAIGARGNATSGKQEMIQQRESDTGTFHYADNLAKTVLHEGRMLMQWVPRLYGSRQIARIIGADEQPSTVRLTQALPSAVSDIRTSNGMEKVYNLGVGKYDVAVTTGPSYTTRRMESSAMMSDLVRADPTIMQKAGDIVVRGFDMHNADELADRLRAFLPPQVLQNEDEGAQNQEAMRVALQQVQAMQQQIQARAKALEEIEKKIEQKDRQISDEEQKIAMDRVRLAAEKQVLDARRAEVEARIALAAKEAADRVTKAAAAEPAADNEINEAANEDA